MPDCFTPIQVLLMFLGLVGGCVVGMILRTIWRLMRGDWRLY